jgi:hypothetical protein
MCHWVREPDRRRDIVGTERPGRSDFMRPRFVGAVAVALVALIAAAASLLSTSTAAVSDEQVAAVTPVAARVNAPTGAVIEQTATTLDDGVPSSQATQDTARAGGHCDHGL